MYLFIYLFILQGSDKKHVQATTVVILVQDENDNTPTFSQQSYEVEHHNAILYHIIQFQI